VGGSVEDTNQVLGLTTRGRFDPTGSL